MMRIIVIVLVLKISHCFSQTDGTFLIYSTHTKDCLGDSLQNVIACNPLSLGQQFRWTSGRRIFNVGNKKCLAVGRSSVGSNLIWSTCDADSSMQKWDCYSDFLFGLKNESLYLSVQGTKQVKLSNNPGDEGKWTVYGTVDSVCSRPYEELYTHGGNAFGRPCHFPFRYKTKWYTECTDDDTDTNNLWCAIESVYELNELWGYCPTQNTELYTQDGNAFGRPCHFPFRYKTKWYTECTHNDRDYLWCAIESEYELNELWGYCPIENTEIWNKDPKTGIYYQVTERSVLTWHQARKSCQQQGGDLLSITKPHEQTFRSELISHSDVQLWIGLNSLDASSGWRWANGQPLRYLKWLSGQPSSQPGHNCAVANNDYGTDWSTAICSEKHGYICQKGLPTPTIPPVVDKGFCQSPWIPYSGHCYLLNREKTTWVEARDACLREGGDLLSILSVEEQSFVISQLGYFNTDELWLGFSDLTSPMLFEWSDHSSVPFTWWEESEPSPADEEDCVVMRGEEGKWANEICQRQCGYICKKKTNSNPSVNDTVVTSPDCKPGWVRFGSYCYTTGSETKTFEEAKQMCEEKGSYLVDITNRVENAFLVSLVGARTEKHFWIGLSIRKDQHTFEWTNTNKVAFTHFNAGMPGGKKGCVAMTTGMLAGLWDVLNCSNKEKYICKHMAEGVTTTPPTFTTTAPKCAMGWYPLPNRDLCFKLFDPGYEHVKSWPESLAFCRELGGDLLSIHSDDDFSASPAFSTEAWIGYSIRDPSAGYMWSDGSSSSYENWQTGQPDNFNNVENCVKAHFHWRLRYNGQWSDLHCEDRKAWFCEIQKGVTPKEVKIQSRRVTPKEVKIQSRTYNTTSDGWIIFKGNQYYIDRGFSMPMAKARSFCKQRHSDLVVINDEEERVFVWHQARYALQDIYIGMYIDMDKSITWMDGSPVVFQAWAANQPAFLNSEENCIKMTQSQGLWESVHCADHKKFVCKRNGTAPMSVTPAPTESPRGCTSDWLHFMGQCYKIGPGLKTWMEARSYCRSLGGDLTSVLTKIQHAFLTLLMDDSTPDLWIGLSDMAIRTYRWTDGSEIHSSRWAKGEPVSHQHMVSACVVMGNMRRAELGKWVTRDCNNTNGFICRRAPDGSVVNPSTTRAPNTFVKIGNSSYLAVEISLTWKDAKLHCEAQGARLASIRDVPALSYATLQAHRCGQPMWIGLNTMETDGYFLWIDNWHLNMESWAYDEPRRENPCVYVNGYGTWQTASCNQTYYSLCKKTTEMAPTVPARYPGVCPDRTDIYPKMKWLSYKASCYAFVTKEQTWNTALRICMTRGAKLLSIEDPMEGTFITNYITLFPADYTYFWMGLFKIHGGHWLWHDDSVVDYTNWDPSENDDSSEDEAVCASISTITTQWSKRHCAKRFPFICKVAKDTKSESKTADTDPAATEPEGHGMYVVGSVLVVIAALGILAGLVYVYHRKSKNQAFSFQGPVFYNQIDPESEGKESNILVNQMEINEQEQVL